MLDRMATLVQTGNSAVIADAYTGCGGLLNVARTVKGCERAGVTVIRIEDPEFPNKCGHKRSSVACRWRRWSRRSASRAKRAQTKKTS